MNEAAVPRRLPPAPLLAASAVLVIMLGGFFVLARQDSAQDAQIAALQAQLSGAEQRADAQAAQALALAQRIEMIDSAQDSAERRITELLGRGRNGLLAMQASELVRLAAERLTLLQDVNGAVVLLQAADTALGNLRGVDAGPARAALAIDLARLREARIDEHDQIWLRLAVLPERMDQLAHDAPGRKAAATEAPIPVVAEEAPQSLGERLAAAFNRVVPYRRIDEPLAPMLTANERALAAQNFRLLIEQAQLALLQRRTRIYRHSLEQADRWLVRMAAGDPTRRTDIHQEISRLKALDPAGALPDLANSAIACARLAAALAQAGNGAQP